jgi:hypothetical protein
MCVVPVFHFISCPCSVCGQVARSIRGVRLPFFFCWFLLCGSRSGTWFGCLGLSSRRQSAWVFLTPCAPPVPCFGFASSSIFSSRSAACHFLLCVLILASWRIHTRIHFCHSSLWCPAAGSSFSWVRSLRTSRPHQIPGAGVALPFLLRFCGEDRCPLLDFFDFMAERLGLGSCSPSGLMNQLCRSVESHFPPAH